MKDLIKKILKENEDLGWANDIIDDSNLPFTIGNPIKKPELKNIFRINVRWMSGDGDHYEWQSNDFPAKDLDYFIKILTLYMTLKDGYWGGDGVIEGLMVTLGICDNEDDCWETMSDLIPRDVTGGDDYYPAAVRDLNVTFFDESGVERSVTLKPLTKKYRPKDFGSRY